MGTHLYAAEIVLGPLVHWLHPPSIVTSRNLSIIIFPIENRSTRSDHYYLDSFLAGEDAELSFFFVDHLTANLYRTVEWQIR